LRFDRKIYVVFCLVLSGFIPLILVAFFSLHKLISEQHSLVAVHAIELNLAELLRYEKESQFSAMPVYLLSGNTHVLDKFNVSHLHFQNYMAKMAEVSKDPKSLALLEKLRKSESELYKLTSPIVERKRHGASATEIDRFVSRDGGKDSTDVNKTLDELVAYESTEFETARVAAKQTSSKIFEGFVFSTVLVLIFALFVTKLMIQAIRQKSEDDRNRELILAQESRLSNARKETVEVVSHDLKNPLGTIKMCVEMMNDRLQLENRAQPELDQCLRMVTRSVASMENLIGNLLDHAKIEADHLVLETEPCRIAEQIKDIVTRHELMAKSKNISLQFESSGSLPAVACDRARIEQVIFNLLGNALKFTPAGGQVVVLVTAAAGFLRVSVCDGGPGIQADLLPHIFDRYWQVRETSRLGTGLGLSIAKAIVVAHKGDIWVESQVGRGSTFHFTLPLNLRAFTSRPAEVGATT
jgi:signal transduction histidine kinase